MFLKTNSSRINGMGKQQVVEMRLTLEASRVSCSYYYLESFKPLVY